MRVVLQSAVQVRRRHADHPVGHGGAPGTPPGGAAAVRAALSVPPNSRQPSAEGHANPVFFLAVLSKPPNY